ncbi:pyridoxamine 5'-phosphate oxidase family protein [Streptomyces sp. NPDC059629]|uniref:pyridoxamine 5'-phosphate oxidase family protein n=1 Tax=Streptomyces sp. NPDC059629 TaxID=3346889 RepID=UPI0036BE422A
MSASPVPPRLVEVSGEEAQWLPDGSTLGRLVYAQRDLTVIRPARHVGEYGRMVVRAPDPAVPATAAYHVDDIRTVAGAGWTVTVSGPAEVITDPDEAAHCHRTLAGWTHGLHDTLLRLHPKTVAGFRLAPAEA